VNPEDQEHIQRAGWLDLKNNAEYIIVVE